MKKQSNFQAYCRALWDEPINKVFAVLEIVGFVTAAALVIDDWGEAAATLFFVAALFCGSYLTFQKQREAIAKLQQALIDIAPDVVPMPLETPSYGAPVTLHIRNEGKSPARNISIKMNHRDAIFSAKKGTLKPDENAFLELKGSLIATVNSRVGVRRRMANDPTILICEFSTPSGVTYIRQWECEWGAEWTLKKSY